MSLPGIVLNARDLVMNETENTNYSFKKFTSSWEELVNKKISKEIQQTISDHEISRVTTPGGVGKRTQKDCARERHSLEQTCHRSPGN